MFKGSIFFILFTIVGFSIPKGLRAQFVVKGKILNQSDAQPVSNASVFLSNATIGGKTAPDGTFVLGNVKPGKYELVVSIVGFETYRQTIMVNNSNIRLPDITVFRKTIALQEVTVKFDRNRDRNLEWFTEEFLGTSDIAKECKILNPEILDLDYDDATGILTASSDDFIEIENKALGYKIYYLLTNFSWSNKDRKVNEIHYEGHALFHDLEGTARQNREWQKRRQEVYENSAVHFLRSALGNRLEEEGFRAYQIAVYPNPLRPRDSLIEARINFFRNLKSKRDNRRDSLSYWVKKSRLPKTYLRRMQFPLNREDIIKFSGQPGIYALNCENDGLYIAYNEDHHFHVNNNFDHLDATNKETTVVNFISPNALFDRNGGLTDANSLTFYGAWGQNRIAESLPVNYEVPQNLLARSDSTVVKNIALRLKIFSANHIVEKAYLDFDRSYYVAGDTIYFKAYVTLGQDHKLSNLSGVLHVDLIDTKNQIAQSLTLRLTDGVAWGDFALPDSLIKGNYRIRAYTRWMCNNVEGDFFYQTIPVASVINKNLSENNAIQSKATPGTADIQFFPEGGSLVVNIRSKVAFKAIGTNGLGVKVKGTVVDNTGKVLTSFISNNLGMGYFFLDPSQEKTYTAQLIYSDGTDNTGNLPFPVSKGIALSVNNDLGDKAVIRLLANKAFFNANRNKDFTLLIYSGGIAFTFLCRLNSPVVKVEILKTDLQTGVARVTLFSPVGEPLSERLIFIQNNDQLNLEVTGDKPLYSKRDEVILKVNATTSAGKPVNGHFSVSVIDESQAPIDENTESSIMTNILLTSEVKGYIEKPAYYFNNPSDQTRADLDVLMLTQGYRRFEWKQVLNDTPDKIIYNPEKFLELAGTVKTPSGKPVSNGEVILVASEANLFRDTTTDANGNFRFTDLPLTDTVQVVLKARKENKNDNLTITVQQTVYPAILPVNIYDPITLSSQPGAAAALQQRYNNYKKQQLLDKKSIQLKQVDIRGNRRPKVPELTYSSNLNGPGHANQVIMGNVVQGCINVMDCLNGKVFGVKFENGIAYNIRNTRGPTSVPMTIIIDGVIIDANSRPLDDMNASDISSIEVLRSGAYLAIYGSNAAGGALVVTTKRGGEDSRRVKPKSLSGLLAYPFIGYYKAKTFYSPKYTISNTAAQHPDERTTIYWNPNVITDKDGKASFEYFNSDTSGNYRIVIEGIDDNGNLGRQVYRYKVE